MFLIRKFSDLFKTKRASVPAPQGFLSHPTIALGSIRAPLVPVAEEMNLLEDSDGLVLETGDVGSNLLTLDEVDGTEDLSDNPY